MSKAAGYIAFYRMGTSRSGEGIPHYPGPPINQLFCVMVSNGFKQDQSPIQLLRSLSETEATRGEYLGQAEGMQTLLQKTCCPRVSPASIV